jgi:hypothetical protein
VYGEWREVRVCKFPFGGYGLWALRWKESDKSRASETPGGDKVISSSSGRSSIPFSKPWSLRDIPPQHPQTYAVLMTIYVCEWTFLCSASWMLPALGSCSFGQEMGPRNGIIEGDSVSKNNQFNQL